MSNPIVLFLCTGNSARSIMAEAILRELAGDRFDVRSAGFEPKGVNPLTLRVLAEDGVDTEGLTSKPSSDFLGKVRVAHAVVVCERAQQQCPRVFPFALHMHYWPFQDPAAATGNDEQKLAVFRSVRDQIRERITQWLEEAEAASARA